MKNLVRIAPFALAFAFFLLYCSPIMPGNDFNLSLIEPDRIHHEFLEDFNKIDLPAFKKYSIGAHLLDWVPVHGLVLAFGEKASDSGDQYKYLTAIYAAWYHCLLAALCPLILFFIIRPYVSWGTGIWAMLFFGLNPVLAYWACSAGVNMPFLFFSLLSLLTMERWGSSAVWIWAALTGVVCAMAFVTKEFQGFFMVTFPILLWELRRLRKKPLFTRKLFFNSTLAFLCFAGTLYLLSFEWKIPGIYTNHIGHYLSTDPEVLSPSVQDFWKSQSIILWAIPTLILAFLLTGHSFALTPLSVAGFWPVTINKNKRMWILVLPTLVYFLFVVVHYDVLFGQYLLLLLPLFAAFSAIGQKELLASNKNYLNIAAGVLTAIAVASLLTQILFIHHDIANDPIFQVNNYFRDKPYMENTSVATFPSPAATAPDLGLAKDYPYGRDYFLSERPKDFQPDYILVDDVTYDVFTQSLGIENEGKEQLGNLLFPGPKSYSMIAEFKNSRILFKHRFGMLNVGYRLYMKGTGVTSESEKAQPISNIP